MAFRDDLPALVQKFAPFLKLHPDEANLPSNTDWYASQVEYVESDGTVHAPGWAWSAVPLAADDYLQIPDAAASTLEPGNLATAQVYVHALPVQGAPDEVDLQYWVFYPFNGSETLRMEGWAGGSAEQLTTFSHHQGDWEVVKVRINSAEQIVAVYMSQHSGGVWLTAAPSGDPSAGYSVVNATHPVAYVAQGSHAHYPAAGGPFEIGSFDLKAVEFMMVDYTADGGQPFDLSQPNRCVIVQNDCVGVFSYKPTPPGWLAFQGDWGAPTQQSMSPTEVVQAFIGVVQAMTIGGTFGAVVAAAIAYLSAAPAAVIVPLGILIGSLIFVTKGGPRNPPFQGSWASAPPLLPWAKDRLISKSSWSASWNQVALVAYGQTSGKFECYFNAGSIASGAGPVNWATFQGGNWTDRKTLAGVTADGAVSVAATDTAGGAMLFAVVDGRLQAWMTTDMETAQWAPLADFPSPPAASPAALATVNGLWIAAFVSPGSSDPAAKNQLAVMTSPDLKKWTGPTPIVGTSCAAPAERMGWAPSAVTMGGQVVVAYTAPALPDAPGPKVMVVHFDGTTWDGPQGVSGAYVRATGGASLAMVDGSLVCAFADTTKQVRFATSLDGIVWSQAAALPSAQSVTAPTIAASSQQALCVHPGQGNTRLWWNLAAL